MLNKILKYIVSVILIIALVIVIYYLLLPSKQKSNVVIVLIDTLRADHIDLYGYHRNTMPNLKKVSKNGLVLKNHFANSPWTKPSVASIITGLHPTAHGSKFGQFEDLNLNTAPFVEILSANIDTMAEILRDNGYITYAFVTNYHMTPRFGYHQGYDHYRFSPQGSDPDKVCAADKNIIQSAMRILEINQDQPVFIWCHLMSVHGYRFPEKFNKFHSQKHTPIPRDAPQREKVEKFNSIEQAIDHYDNSIFFSDKLVGDFFNLISTEYPNTIFIVTSDHGEEFYDHGGFEHCLTLYNEITKIPCIIWGPGVPQGVLTGTSDTIDLLPTILKNLEIEVNKDLRGKILFNNNEILTGKKELFAEQHHRGDFRRFALIREDKKMIINQSKITGEETFEFYQNALNRENENIYDQVDQETMNLFKKRINFYKSRNRNYFKRKIGRSQLKDLNKEDIKRLRTLGYIK